MNKFQIGFYVGCSLVILGGMFFFDHMLSLEVVTKGISEEGVSWLFGGLMLSGAFLVVASVLVSKEKGVSCV